MDDRAAGDRLRAGAETMPPQLSDETVAILKGIWG
jgi:hypothetical protein